jgi:outer membrane protein TolC
MTGYIRNHYSPMAIKEIMGSRGLAIKPIGESFSRPRFFVVSVISFLKFIFIITCTVMIFGVTILSQPAQGASVIPDERTLTPSGPLNYEEGVKIALHQSPYFKKSSLQIQLSRLDETDSRYGLIPPLTFQTYYYVNRPSNVSGTPFYLSFSTAPYNPFGAYFSLQAQKLITQAAILAHLQAISSGLEQLGQIFLQLERLKQLAAWQQDLVKLSREKFAYMENRYRAGTATSLEVKEAQQGLEIEQSELKSYVSSQKRQLANLKNFLGLKPSQKITPDLRDTLQQVLGSFDPNAATWEQTQGRSYTLKIYDIKMKLQGYKVNLAIASTLPNIIFNYQTPDPLSSTAQGLYAGIGLQIPVWDGFKRIRNITRQKLILQKFGSEKSMEENDLQNQFYAAQEKFQDAAFALHIAQSKVELAQLEARQMEISYQSGSVTLPEDLKARGAVLKAKKKAVNQALDYGVAALALRRISGDLGHAYVHAGSWQN